MPLCVYVYMCLVVTRWERAGLLVLVVVSGCELSLSHWYPGSGVILDCIDSWSLHPYLLYLDSNFLKHCFWWFILFIGRLGNQNGCMAYYGIWEAFLGRKLEKYFKCFNSETHLFTKFGFNKGASTFNVILSNVINLNQPPFSVAALEWNLIICIFFRLHLNYQISRLGI